MFGFGTTKKKVFILLGQEDKETLCGALADAYESGARAAGHEVRRANIGELTFDPLLHHGYKVVQELEPDLKRVQEDIKWAEHIVILYPTWWSMMPAILKGFFDRAWLPGFAYHFNPHLGWHKLLKGRSARVIITMDSLPVLARMLFGDATNEIARAILWFSGISPVRVKRFGSVKHATEPAKEKLKAKVFAWGKKAK